MKADRMEEPIDLDLNVRHASMKIAWSHKRM